MKGVELLVGEMGVGVRLGAKPSTQGVEMTWPPTRMDVITP